MIGDTIIGDTIIGDTIPWCPLPTGFQSHYRIDPEADPATEAP